MIFLTAEANKNDNRIEHVEVRTYKLHRDLEMKGHHYLRSAEEAVLNGQAVVRSVIELIKSNWEPDIVITHGGNGLGMFIKDLLPQKLHVGYFEWYFTGNTTQWLVKDMEFDTQLMARMRNTSILHELAACDIGVVPTEWQRKQFPREYHEKLNVIFDGIDKNFFKEAPKKWKIQEEVMIIRNRESKEEFRIQKDEKIITYATRGMEPLRGFPEFIKAAITALKADNEIKVVVAGKDRTAYSYGSPEADGSWKNYLLKDVDIGIKKRIVFCGLLDYVDYRKLLWRSDLHCYFTRPYVTSWSMFEAAACGCNMLINSNEATKGIVERESVHHVDLDIQENMVNKMINGLNDRKAAKLMNGFDTDTNVSKWANMLNYALKRKSGQNE